MSEITDVTKLCNKANLEQNRISIKKKHNTLVDWADQGIINFNVDKCIVMQNGTHNRKSEYLMTEQEITKVDQQRDHGILITKDLNQQESK